MPIKIPKTLTYPIIILSLVSIILIAVYAFLNSIGERMNPPQPAFKFERSVSKAIVWRDADGEWLCNRSGQLSIFETDNKKFESESVKLKKMDQEAFGDVLLLIVRESLDKEKGRILLEALNGFALKKVYVASPYDDTLSALKKIEPRFWYAASPRSWVKWSLFETFGIEKAFTLEVDFVFIDKDISKLMSPNLSREIKRRRLPVINAKKDGSLIFH
jgi:hypothetical protein